MKRSLACLVALALLLVVFTDGASSQMKFAVGLRTGINFGTMSFDPDPTAGNTGVSQGGRTGFLVGAAAELAFDPMFAAELDIMYTLLGASFTQGQATQTIKLSELQIPILFKVKFLKTGKIRPYAFAGPVLGFNMSASSVVEQNGNTVSDVDYKDFASSLDFALQFGGGAEYLLTPQFGILLDVRYDLGLSNILDTSKLQVPQGGTAPTWHTRGFMIQVGGMYHI